MNGIQEHLCRLRGSDIMSITAKSVCSNLASFVNLHEDIKNLIQIPSIQQAISHDQFGTWIDDILEGSLRLVDLSGFSRDTVCLVKESVQDLESPIRRNRSETVTVKDIYSCVASRKKISQMINKNIKNIKSFNQNLTPLLEKAEDLKAILTVLKEMEAISSSVLKSILILVSGAKRSLKQRSWLWPSKLTQTSRVHGEMEQEIDEMTMQDFEEGLESFFRSLVKTRVSLLDAWSH
ncbi:uncharacterized protein [Primulina eburnea]|uniref:uncharacterized protein n=1 Tax=Primulina eburnea TaxID=1245227 RepID=UPI003C6CBD3A